jgi:hypothetical protein
MYLILESQSSTETLLVINVSRTHRKKLVTKYNQSGYNYRIEMKSRFVRSEPSWPTIPLWDIFSTEVFLPRIPIFRVVVPVPILISRIV